jgi:hypothetical protein
LVEGEGAREPLTDKWHTPLGRAIAYSRKAYVGADDRYIEPEHAELLLDRLLAARSVTFWDEDAGMRVRGEIPNRFLTGRETNARYVGERIDELLRSGGRDDRLAKRFLSDPLDAFANVLRRSLLDHPPPLGQRLNFDGYAQALSAVFVAAIFLANRPGLRLVADRRSSPSFPPLLPSRFR